MISHEAIHDHWLCVFMFLGKVALCLLLYVYISTVNDYGFAAMTHWVVKRTVRVRGELKFSMRIHHHLNPLKPEVF